jgi:hypothetical protein
VQGTHYTLSSNTVTFTKGKIVDTITVTAVHSQYLAGRKDTLVFSISDPANTSTGLRNTFRLNIAGPCFEGDVDLNKLLGAYPNTSEVWGNSPWGPYRTTISAVNQLTPTTGTLTVTNIFDAGWDPLVFTLDWTDPNNRRVTLVTQRAGGDAGGSFGAQYDGMPYGVRPVPASAGGLVGTFSICNETLVLRMQVGIFGVGYSSSIYTLTMGR